MRTVAADLGGDSPLGATLAAATFRPMRPVLLLAALLAAAVLIGTLLDPANWFGDKGVLVVVAAVATAWIAFNWWELWSTGQER